MSLSNDSQRKIGIILQYMQMVLSSVISLVYTPIMLRILGQVEYGIYNVASSTISYLALLSLGFGISYIRFYSIYKNKNEISNIASLNGLYLIVFSIIGVISLIAGLFFTIKVNWFYNDTFSIDDIKIARILMLLLTLNLSLSFPASVFTSYITSQEKFVFQKLVNIGLTLVSPAVSIIVLYLHYGSIGMVLSSTIISIIVYIINVFYCLTKLGMRFTFKNPNFKLLKDIFVFSIFIAINQLVEQINFQTDKIILGKIVNGTAVAVYAIGANLKTLYVNISSAISSVYAPEINRIVSRNDKDMDAQLNRIFIKVGRVQWFVIMLIMSGFVFFGKYFVIIWAGSDYVRSYYVALLLMLPMTIVLIQTIGGEVQRAKNLHHIRSIIFLGMAIINVVISIRLSEIWGEVGAALGTTISLVLCNIIFMNFWYHYKIGLNIFNFWKSILCTLPAFTIPFIFGALMMKLCMFKSVLEFIIIVLIYTVLYIISIYFLGFNKGERTIIKSMIKRINNMHLRGCEKNE